MAFFGSWEQPIDKVASLGSHIAFSKILSGANYGAAAYIYKPITIRTMELSSSQYLSLALLDSLATDNVMSCILLADLVRHVQQLQSKHLKVWLIEDFAFPQEDIKKAMALLTQLLASGVIKLPSYMMEMMYSVGIKYGITGVQLTSLLEQSGGSLGKELEKAVVNNNPGDIMTLVIKGGDVNETTQTGDYLLHLAARSGSCDSIAALGLLKADLEVLNSSNATPLEIAVKNDNVPVIKALIKARAKVDRRLSGGNTYLHIAAAGAYNGALKTFLEAGLEVNSVNQAEETALVQAVKVDNACGVEILLENGADACVLTEEGRNIYEIAAESENVDMLIAFIRAAVKPDVRSENSVKSLYNSVRNGVAQMLKGVNDHRLTANSNDEDNLTLSNAPSSTSVQEMLLQIGAGNKFESEKGEGSLHLATVKGSLELVKALVQGGVDLDAQDDRGATALMVSVIKSKGDIMKFLLYSGANPNTKDKDGLTPLHLAAAVDCVGSVIALLEAGATVNVRDNEGETPVFIAALNNNLAALQMILDLGADPTLRNIDDLGAIHCAASNGYVEVVSLLLNEGVAVDTKALEYNTALHFAAENGHAAVVSVLLDKGADPDLRNKDGYRVLHCAAKNGHSKLVSLLLDAGVKVNSKTTWDYTALHLSAAQGHADVVSVLLDRGADPKARAGSGWTPLIEASIGGSLETIKLLLRSGAQINDRCGYGLTALYYAFAEGHREVGEYLEFNGGII